jgi:hypothetical protein
VVLARELSLAGVDGVVREVTATLFRADRVAVSSRV